MSHSDTFVSHPTRATLNAEVRALEDVVTRLEEFQGMLRDQGVRDAAPFMTLSFLALSVIPALKITDRGLVDVERFELVPLAV